MIKNHPQLPKPKSVLLQRFVTFNNVLLNNFFSYDRKDRFELRTAVSAFWIAYISITPTSLPNELTLPPSKNLDFFISKERSEFLQCPSHFTRRMIYEELPLNCPYFVFTQSNLFPLSHIDAPNIIIMIV